MNLTKTESKKDKIILLAILNYLLEFHTGDMVFDGFSPSKQWYLSELRQVESDIKTSRLARIKTRLDRHISRLRHQYDQEVNKYVSEKTGYEIDIFEPYKTDVLPIITRGYLEPNDIYLVENYLKAYSTNPKEQAQVNALKMLLSKWEAKFIGNKGEFITQKFYEIVKGNKTLSFNEAEYEAFIKEDNKKWLLYEVTAPNGEHKLSIQFNGKGEYACTYVLISLKGGVGSIYAVRGEKAPIKAYWKNDNHVIIEHLQEYETLLQHNEVSSYGEETKIEYINPNM